MSSELTTIILMILSSSLVGSIVAWWLNRGKQEKEIDLLAHDAEGSEASTYAIWLESNSKLSKELENVRQARRDDLAYWENEMEKERAKYERKLAELVANYEAKLGALERRVAQLEDDRMTLIMENHILRSGEAGNEENG
jgi:hypothetical protein